MRSRAMRGAAMAVAMVVILFPVRLQAQVLLVPERDLAFGLVMPGTQTVVAPTDAVRSAQLRLQGRGTFQVNFVLPTALTRAQGGSMPLTWGATDGRLTSRNTVTVFDPRQMLNIRITGAQQDAQLNLGAQVAAAPGQLAGTYTATVVVLVVQTGN